MAHSGGQALHVNGSFALCNQFAEQAPAAAGQGEAQGAVAQVEPQEAAALKYRMWLYPYSSYAALGFLLMVVGLMAYFEETRIALFVGPAFLILLTVLFYVFKLQPTQRTQTN